MEKAGQSQVPVRIQMGGHCLICLRKTSAQRNICKLRGEEVKSDLFEIVPTPAFEDDTVSLSSLLKCLNRIWGCIVRRKREKSGDWMRIGGEKKEVFGCLPEMCHFCVEKLTRVEKVMRSLKEMLENLGQIARESSNGRYSWRGESFVKAMSSSTLEKGAISQTLGILEMQGHLQNPDGRNNDWKESASVHLEEETCSFSAVNPSSDPLATTSVNYQENDDDSRELDACIDENDSDDSADDWPIANEDEDQCNTTGVNEGLDDDPVYIKSENEEDNSSLYPTDSDYDEADEDNEQLNRDTLVRPKKVTNSGQSLSNPRRIVLVEDIPVPLREPKKLTNSKLKCDLCKVTVENILDHVRAHVGDDYLIKCPNPTCSKAAVFAQPSSMYEHVRYSTTCCKSVPDPKVFLDAVRICEICGLKNGNAIRLQRHLLEEHETDKKKFPCPIRHCKERFSVKQSVVLHLPHHEFCQDVTVQRCQLCTQQIKLDEMEAHLRDTHQIQEIIKCKQCSFQFSTREHLIDHLFDHRFTVLSCDICNDGKSFTRLSKLRAHYFENHQIGQKYPCEICEYTCWSKETLLNHISQNHRKTYSCADCSEIFTSPKYLQDHKIQEHGAEPYICKLCGENFTMKSLFQAHKEQNHQGIEVDGKFHCEVPDCGKVFGSIRGLHFHVAATHFSEKFANTCDLCKKSFSQPGTLRKHKATVHLVLRPHVCEICGESFKDKKVFKTHQLIHTGERPLACEICGQRFRHNAGLKTHLKGHQRKGNNFKPNGPLKHTRKRVERKKK